MDQPIACSLTEPGAADQLDAWRELLARIAGAVEWDGPLTVRMEIAAAPGAVSDLIDLAAREAACCPCFTFAVEITATGIAFTVSVPPEAAPVLADFAGLAAR